MLLSSYGSDHSLVYLCEIMLGPILCMWNRSSHVAQPEAPVFQASVITLGLLSIMFSKYVEKATATRKGLVCAREWVDSHFCHDDFVVVIYSEMYCLKRKYCRWWILLDWNENAKAAIQPWSSFDLFTETSTVCPTNPVVLKLCYMCQQWYMECPPGSMPHQSGNFCRKFSKLLKGTVLHQDNFQILLFKVFFVGLILFWLKVAWENTDTSRGWKG